MAIRACITTAAATRRTPPAPGVAAPGRRSAPAPTDTTAQPATPERAGTTPRRRLLTGVATAAASGLVETEASALALPADDARLMLLHAEMIHLRAKEDASWAVLGPMRVGDEGEPAAYAVANAAMDAAADAARALAAAPAVGMAGLAVKAAWALYAQEHRWGDQCGLPESLRADIARLVPAAVVA